MASMTARINTTTHPPPFSLNEWIEANRARLQPPVNNAMIYGKGAQFKLMMVGGPNIRTDFHINRGEEWFWQIKGDMLLKIVDGGTFKDVIIREGECFLLPGGVPHSPQRFAGTMGIVMERERMNEARDGTTELDGLRWYCRSCYHVAHEDFFVCEDLGSQLKVAIDAYYADEKMRTCPHCGTVDALPSVRRGSTTDPVRLDEILYAPPTAASPSVVDSGIQCRNPGPHIAVAWTTTHPPPFSFRGWIDSNRADLQPPVNNKLMFDPSCEFQVQIIGGPNQRTDYHVEEGEEWFYMVQGDMCLKIVDGGEFRDVHIREGESFLLPANIPHSPQRMPNTIGLVIERRRRPRVRTEADAPAGAATTIHEMDHLRWYCSNCRAIVHEDAFVCQNLGSQLKVAIEAYYADEATRTCAACRTIDQKPALRC